MSDYIVEKNCCRNLLSHYNSTLFLDGILRQILCRKMRSKKIVEPGQKILSKKAVAYCRKMILSKNVAVEPGQKILLNNV